MMARQFFAVFAVFTLVFVGYSRFAPAQDRAASPSARLLAAEHVPGELVLKLLPSPGTDSVERAKAFVVSRLGAQAVDSVHGFVTDSRLQVVRLKPAQDLASALD